MRHLLFFFLLGMPMAAFARLGETPEQCRARYGHSIGPMLGRAAAYQKAGLFIVCTFVDGKCEEVIYFKEEKDALGRSKPLSDVEIETLREANAPGQGWKKVITPQVELDVWETESIYSVYKTIGDPKLRIITKVQLNRENAAQEAKEKENLKGL